MGKKLNVMIVLNCCINVAFIYGLQYENGVMDLFIIFFLVDFGDRNFFHKHSKQRVRWMHDLFISELFSECRWRLVGMMLVAMIIVVVKKQ